MAVQPTRDTYATQTMNHPRNSILQLFDPLTDHDDKENTPSQDAMSAFFNRIRSRNSAQYPHSPSLTPRGRLVDVTLDEEWITGAIPEEDDDQEEDLGTDDTPWKFIPRNLAPFFHGHDDDDDEPSTPTPYNPRTPLAEVPFKGDIAPLPRKRLYTRQTLTDKKPSEIVSSPVYPPELSIASLRNTIGDRQHRVVGRAPRSLHTVLEEQPPADPPSSNTSEDRGPDTTSFDWQLQSQDASFDLLNSHVSFLAVEELTDESSFTVKTVEPVKTEHSGMSPTLIFVLSVPHFLFFLSSRR